MRNVVCIVEEKDGYDYIMEKTPYIEEAKMTLERLNYERKQKGLSPLKLVDLRSGFDIEKYKEGNYVREYGEIYKIVQIGKGGLSFYTRCKIGNKQDMRHHFIQDVEKVADDWFDLLKENDLVNGRPIIKIDYDKKCCTTTEWNYSKDEIENIMIKENYLDAIKSIRSIEEGK